MASWDSEKADCSKISKGKGLRGIQKKEAARTRIFRGRNDYSIEEWRNGECERQPQHRKRKERKGGKQIKKNSRRPSSLHREKILPAIQGSKLNKNFQNRLSLKKKDRIQFHRRKGHEVL